MRITESKLRRIIRKVIAESFLNTNPGPDYIKVYENDDFDFKRIRFAHAKNEAEVREICDSYGMDYTETEDWVIWKEISPSMTAGDHLDTGRLQSPGDPDYGWPEVKDMHKHPGFIHKDHPDAPNYDVAPGMSWKPRY